MTYPVRMTSISLQDLLYDYFIQNRSLSVPGIGTFELSRISAQTDFANRKILAPGYDINYDSMNDSPQKDLFDYISRKRDIPEWEAIKEVNDFARELKTEIRAGRKVNLDGIGQLMANTGDDLFFEPKPVYYGFGAPVPAFRVVRQGISHRMRVGDRELGTQEMQDILAGEDYTLEKEGWWIHAAIISAIAVLLIAARIFLADQGIPAGRMDPIHPSKAAETHFSQP